MKKRLLSLVLAAVLAATAFAGCSSASTSSSAGATGPASVCSERNQRGKERIYDRMSGGRVIPTRRCPSGGSGTSMKR